MALCAGRDVLHGGLGQPDQWSFATAGKVWVNQGWLSGLFLYVSYAGLDELGPVLIKGIILIVCLLLVYIRCRWLNASPEASLMAMIMGTLSIAPLFTIRAETFALLYFLLLTGFLTAPTSQGLFRQLGALFTMLLWSNSHGTFMVGFLLIGAKTALESGRSLMKWSLRDRPEERMESAAETISAGDRSTEAGSVPEASHSSGTGSISPWEKNETVRWAITWFLCLPVMAFANPFGLSNLQMPFRQIGAEMWTGTFRFWAPLIQFRGISDIVLYHSNRALPFIIFSSILLLTSAVTCAVAGRTSLRQFFGERISLARGDLLAEFVICLMVLAVTFRWGRTAVVAGLLLVPLTAFMFQSLLAAVTARMAADLGRVARGSGRLIFPAISFGLLILVTWFFLERTLPPYVQNNPMMPDSSPVKRIHGMFWDSADLTTFLKENSIKGNIFSNFVMSDFLLLNVPDIRIWVDVRTQSIYSPGTWREFGKVAGVNPGDKAAVADALQLLDRYSVAAVVLDHAPRGLMETLTASGKWLPLYTSQSGTIYLPVESPQLQEFRETGRLDSVRFPDESSRVLSLAFLWLAAEKRIPADIEADLRSASLESPSPLLYYAMFLGRGGRNGCLEDYARLYFVNELSRLSGLNFMRANGVNSVLKSMLQIISTLEYDRQICPAEKKNDDFSALKRHVLDRIAKIKQEFLALGER